MRLWQNGRAETGCGWVPRLSYRTTILYRFLQTESRLSGNASISPLGCKNVPEKITGR